MIPHRWEGVDDGERWSVGVEHDCFKDGDPFVVSVIVGKELAPLPPVIAREMAAALEFYADAADDANSCERCGALRNEDPADASNDPAAEYAAERCVGEGGHFW